MIYILIILYCLFCIIVYDGKERKPQNIYNYWFLVGVLILLSGIQYRMGADIILYMTEYNYYEKDFSISYLFGFSSRRPLWVLFNILCKSLGFSFVVFKSIIALFVNIVIAKFIVRRTKYIYTALLVYFLILYFHFNFNVLRNSISICFFLLSYGFLEKKNILPFILLNIVAIGFHESVIIPALFSSILFFVNIGNKKFIIPILILIGILLPLIPANIREFFQLASLYYDVGIVGERAVHYIEKDNYSDFALSFFGYSEWVIKLGFFVWLYYKYSHRKEYRDYTTPLFLYILFLILNNAIPILYRIAEYYTLFYIVCITEVVKEDNHDKIRLNKFLVALVFVFYIHTLFLFVGEKEIIQYYPYTSIIDKNTVPQREKMYGEKEYFDFIR